MVQMIYSKNSAKKIKGPFSNLWQGFLRIFLNYQIFISVENEDIKSATKIQEDFRRYGAKVFVYNSIEGGEKWRESIQRNLTDCDLFIVLLSSKSLKSPNVMLEMGGAYYMKKDYLMVLLEEVNKKKLGMVDEFHYIHYRDVCSSVHGKMWKIYWKRILMWLIITGVIAYLTFFK